MLPPFSLTLPDARLSVKLVRAINQEEVTLELSKTKLLRDYCQAIFGVYSILSLATRYNSRLILVELAITSLKSVALYQIDGVYLTILAQFR